ncbi:MAG TPA: nucleoside phosphorylase [Anaerolineaceae bacterium]|nr:nucleoside phosphorylase [Anaerolineaceae bacterium]
MNQEPHRQHHIDMLPGDIAPTVLVPGDPGRVALFAEQMDEAHKVAQKREYLTYTGKKDGVAVSCTSSGIGPSPTAIGTEELIRIGAKNIIRMGTCGAIQPFMKAGDIIIVTAAVRGERATEEFISIDYPAIASHYIVRAGIEACKRLKLTYHVGMVRTHDAFYLESPWAFGDYKARLQKWVDLGVLAVENEAATMFVVASMQGARAGAILLSSDPIFGGSENDPDLDLHKQNLVRVSIETAKILHEMGLD